MDTCKPNYRTHWYSDSAIAENIGCYRQRVNECHGRLQEKGIISRHEQKKGRTRLTVRADFSPLAETDFRPAPRPADTSFHHFPDDVLNSGTLKSYPALPAKSSC